MKRDGRSYTRCKAIPSQFFPAPFFDSLLSRVLPVSDIRLTGKSDIRYKIAIPDLRAAV